MPIANTDFFQWESSNAWNEQCMSIDSGPKMPIARLLLLWFIEIRRCRILWTCKFRLTLFSLHSGCLHLWWKECEWTQMEQICSVYNFFLFCHLKFLNRFCDYIFVGKFHINLNSNHVLTHKNNVKRIIPTNSGVIMYPAGNENQRNLNRNKKWKLDERAEWMWKMWMENV